MKRVTGIGGIFFKSENPDNLYAWYEKHLGIQRLSDGTSSTFEWREKQSPEEIGMTVWSIFPHKSKYFDPSRSPFMINYRVDDLKSLLEELRKEGVQVDSHQEDAEY